MTAPTSAPLTELAQGGFVHLEGPFVSIAGAWAAAAALVAAAAGGSTGLDVLGDFVIPPVGGPASRDFQTLHHDFGLPLVPAGPADIGRFTALHIACGTPAGSASTRLVPLGSLLAGRSWPDRRELVRRFAVYGDTHGAWADSTGYVEGSLARVIEAALGGPAVLPSVQDPDFLCGTEFAGLEAELAFFASRGLPVDAVGTEVRLQPGQLLVFDNLMLAHGRRGRRRPGELHQRVFGHRALPVDGQLELRERVLTAFDRSAAEDGG